MKIGLLISELFITQLETLSLFLNLNNMDISILNNYMAEVKLRLGFIETISSLSKNLDDIKTKFNDEEYTRNIDMYKIVAYRNDKVAMWNNFVRNIIIEDSDKQL